MRLNYVVFYVDDAVKATGFYQNAFGLKTRFIHESNMYAEMESGETVLAFAHNEMLEMNSTIEAHKGMKNCFEIAFSTEDVKKHLKIAIQNGAKELKKARGKTFRSNSCLRSRQFWNNC